MWLSTASSDRQDRKRLVQIQPLERLAEVVDAAVMDLGAKRHSEAVVEGWRAAVAVLEIAEYLLLVVEQYQYVDQRAVVAFVGLALSCALGKCWAPLALAMRHISRVVVGSSCTLWLPSVSRL